MKNERPTTSDKPLPSWQWVRETPVAILEENELPAWNDPHQVLAAVRAMGASMLRYPAIGWGAHFFQQSRWLPKYPLIGDRDLYGEISEVMRAHGVKMMAYCHYGVLYHQLEQLRPDWLARASDGTALVWNGQHRMACLNHTSFVEAMRNAIVEVVDAYRPDAVYLDGPAWYGQCYCDDCRRLYEKIYEEKMPDELTAADGSLQKMGRIRDEVIASVVRDVRQAIAGVRDCPLLFNMSLHSRPDHGTGCPERTSAYADGANTTEVHRPGSFWSMLESVKLGQALGKASLCYLPPGPYDTMRTYDSLETFVLGCAYFMHGGTPMLQTVSSYLRDQTGAAVMRKFLDATRPHFDIYYRAQPLRELGLVYSRSTADYGPGGVSEFNKAFTGAFRALLHGHRQFTCLFDTQLSRETLREYKVLYLPSVSVVSSDHAAALREFVHEGGVIIASGLFSLFDHEGRQRDNFALADIMGVDFVQVQADEPYRAREYRQTGPAQGYSLIPEAYIRLEDAAVRSDKYPAGFLVPVSDAVVGVPALKRFIEYAVVAPGRTAEVLATLYLPAGGAFGKEVDLPLGSPPAITVNRFGRGKVVYVSAPLEKIVLRRRLPEARDLIVRMVDLALDDRPIVKLDGPPGVIVNVIQREEAKFVNLLNYCGTMYEDSNPIDWIAPVENIVVQLRVETEPRNVSLLYGRSVPHWRIDGSYLTIQLPRLEIFETIVVE